MGRTKIHTETENETSDQFSELDKKECGVTQRVRHSSSSLIPEEKQNHPRAPSFFQSPVILRTTWTVNLLLGFFTILSMGHFYSLLLIVIISL